LGLSSGPLKAEEDVCEAVFHQDAEVFGAGNLFLLPSGVVWVQTIDPAYGRGGYIDRRYRIDATEEERQALSSLAAKTRFFRLESATGRRIPDELTTRITLRRCDGSERLVQQFDHDASASFKQLATFFRTLMGRAATSTPLYEGAPDFKWHPSEP
jgi:hypothetical protein